MSEEPTSHAPAARQLVIPWRLVILWVIFAVLDTGTQLAFKWGASALENMDFGWAMITLALATPGVWLAVLGYVGSFVVWMLILQRMDLSQAFPMTGLVYITVPAFAWALFGETIDVTRSFGIGLIVAGVVALAHD